MNMEKKIAQSGFNYNIENSKNSQQYNVASPIFGGANIKIGNGGSQEPINQILINNNIINIQHTTVQSPDAYFSHQAVRVGGLNTPDQRDSNGNSKNKLFFVQKGFPSQSLTPNKRSVSPQREDARKSSISINKPKAPEKKDSGYTGRYQRQRSGEIAGYLTNRSKTIDLDPHLSREIIHSNSQRTPYDVSSIPQIELRDTTPQRNRIRQNLYKKRDKVKSKGEELFQNPRISEPSSQEPSNIQISGDKRSKSPNEKSVEINTLRRTPDAIGIQKPERPDTSKTRSKSPYNTSGRMITPNKARPTKPAVGISKPNPQPILNQMISPIANTQQNIRSKSANRTPSQILFNKESSPSENDSEYENELIEKVLKQTKERFNAKFEKKKSPERTKVATQLNFNKKTGLAPAPRRTETESSLKLDEDPYNLYTKSHEKKNMEEYKINDPKQADLGELSWKIKRKEQEIEDYTPFTELKKTDDKWEYNLIDKNLKLATPDVVYTTTGFLEIKEPRKEVVINPGKAPKAETDIITNEEYIKGKTYLKMFGDLPFFKFFYAYKFLVWWKLHTRNKRYERNREKIQKEWIFNNPILMRGYVDSTKYFDNLQETNYFVVRERNNYAITGDQPLRKLQEKYSNETQISLKKNYEDFMAFIKAIQAECDKHKKTHRKTIEKMNEDSMLYKSLHAKEHISKVQEHDRIKAELEADIKYMTVSFDRFLTFLVIKIIISLSRCIRDNEKLLSDTFINRGIKSAAMEVDIIASTNKVSLDPNLDKLQLSLKEFVSEAEKDLIDSLDLSRVLSVIRSSYSVLLPLSNKNFFITIAICTGYARVETKQPIEVLFSKIKDDYSKVLTESEKYKDYADIVKFYEKMMKQFENTLYAPPLDDLIGIFRKMSWALKMLANLTASRQKVGHTLNLCFIKFREDLDGKMQDILTKIREKYLDAMELELTELKIKLFSHIESIEFEPRTIDEFVDKLKDIKDFTDKMEDYNRRINIFLEIGSYLAEFGGRMNDNFPNLLKETKEYLDHTPSVLVNVMKKILRNKKKLRKLIINSYNTLYEKMGDYKKRYINTYFKEKEKLISPEATRKELSERDANIHEVSSKLKMYLEFNPNDHIQAVLQNNKMIPEELAATVEIVQPQIDEDDSETQETTKRELQVLYNSIESLHQDTKKFWQYIEYWSKRKAQYHGTIFREVDLKKFASVIVKVKKYFTDKIFDPDNDDFGRFAKGIRNGIMEQVMENEDYVELFGILKVEQMEPKIWEQLIGMLGLKDINFTFGDLTETNYGEMRDKIENIVFQGKTDAKFEELIDKVQEKWGKELIQFKNYKDTHILNREKAEDFLGNRLEDYRITSERILNIKGISPMFRDKLEQFLKRVDLSQVLMDVMFESDNEYLRADVLEEELIRKKNTILTQYLKEFDEEKLEKIKDAFNMRRKIIETIAGNRKLLSELTEKTTLDIIHGMKNFSDVLRNSWEYVRRVLETKRHKFPRLFFVDDTAYLKLLRDFYSTGDTSGVLSCVFPGIWKFKMRGPDEKLSEEAEKLDIMASEIKNLRPEDKKKMIALVNKKKEILNLVEGKNLGQLVLLATKEGFDTSKCRITAIMDNNYQITLLKTPVDIKNHRFENVLAFLEDEMQETVKVEINNAISSFPNHSLDEWIMDYSVQTILTSLHLIVTHEVYEMIRLLHKFKKALKQAQPRQNVSSSVSASFDSASIIRNQEEGNKSKIVDENDPFELDRLRDETEYILAKPKRSKQIVIYDPQEMVDLFGQNFDLQYMGFDKAEMHTLLQQRSFRGLYLRLQYWVNLLIKHLYDPKKQTDEAKTYYNRFSVNKVCKVLGFILSMRDVVLDIYEKSTDFVPDFEWNKHVRMILDGDNKHCIIECGGWAGYHGNEFTGSGARLLITPVTERYFIFIASALREKSAIGFKTISSQDSAGDVAEEFATMCTIPMQRFHVNNKTNFNLLLSYVNAAAYGNTWVIFEHINSLSLELLSILNKEIQIVQQKVILADLHRSSEVSTVVKLNAPESPPNPNKQNKKRVAYGLFCSVFSEFDRAELAKQENVLQSSFRITSLILPDFEILLKHMLYVNGFVSFIILAEKLNKFREIVEEKVSNQSTPFITEDVPTRKFHFKLHELLNIIEQAVERREALREEFTSDPEFSAKKSESEIHSAKEDLPSSNPTSKRPTSKAGAGLDLKAKEKKAQTELKKIKEDLMNTKKNNTDADMDDFEKILITIVVLELAPTRIRNFFSANLNDTNPSILDDFESMLLDILTQLLKFDPRHVGFIKRKRIKPQTRVIFEKSNMVYTPTQSQQLQEFHNAIKFHGMAIVYGDAWTGKSSLIRLLQPFLEDYYKMKPESFRTVKMNSSLLSSHFPSHVDALQYLLEKVSFINTRDAVNVLCIDGEPSNWIWDLAQSYNYLNKQPLPKNQLPLNQWLQAMDYQKAVHRNFFAPDGKLYRIEDNTYLIFEMTKLGDAPPNLLTSVGLINTKSSLNHRELIEAYDNALYIKHGDNLNIKQKQVYSLLLDYLDIFTEFETEFLTQKLPISVRSLIVTWLKFMDILVTESPYITRGKVDEPLISQDPPREKKTLSQTNSKNNSKRESLADDRTIRGPILEEPFQEMKQSTGKSERSQQDDSSVELDKDNQDYGVTESIDPKRPLSHIQEFPSLEIKTARSGASHMKLTSSKERSIEIEATRITGNLILIELLSIVSFLTVFGMILPQDQRKKFAKLIMPRVLKSTKENKVIERAFANIKLEELFEYFFDSEMQEFEKLDQHPVFRELLNNPMEIGPQQIYIPNKNSIQILSLSYKLALNKENLAIIAPKSTGKTALSKFLQYIYSSQKWCHFIKLNQLKMWQYDTFNQLIMDNYEKKEILGRYRTLSGKFPLIFIEDVSLESPKTDDIDVVEFLRYWKMGMGIMDIKDKRFKDIGKPQCIFTIKEVKEEKEFLDKRFFFETIKMNYTCLDNDQDFATVFKFLANTHGNPAIVRSCAEEIVSISLSISNDLAPIIQDKNIVHSRLIRFLKDLVIILDLSDHMRELNYQRTEYAKLFAIEYLKMSESLSLDYQQQSKFLENVLNHINVEFKGNITVNDIKNIETMFPCIRLPNNLNDQLFYEKKEFYKKFNKLVIDLESTPFKYCFDPNDIHPVIESMWTFFKDSKIPNTHFSLLTNYGDFSKNYLQLLSKLTKYEIIEDVFNGKSDFEAELKKVVNQIITTKKTHTILIINEEEIKNKIILENLILYIEHGVNPIKTDNKFKNEKVQDFKKTITPLMMHDYMINGNPNNINEKTIVNEFLDEISKRLHICLVFKNFDNYLKIINTYPHIKILFRPVLPFCSQIKIEQIISTNISNETKFKNELMNKVYSILKRETLNLLLPEEEFNSYIQSDKLASQFEDIGSFDKYQYYEVVRGRSVDLSANRGKFNRTQEENYHIDHEYFSLKKYMLLSILFPTLLNFFEAKLKKEIENLKLILVGIVDFWATYDMMKDYKSTTIYKSLSINIRIKEIDRIIEKLQIEIDNRDATLHAKLQETSNYYLIKNKTHSTIDNFNENQKNSAGKLRKQLEEISPQEYSKINIDEILKVKKNFVMFVLGYASLIKPNKIITKEDTLEINAICELIKSKQVFIKKLKEAEELDQEKFKAPSLRLTNQMAAMMSKFVSIDDQALPKPFQILYDWCQAWYAQVLSYHDNVVLLENLKDVDKKIKANELYMSSFDNNLNDTKIKVEHLKEEKERLTLESDKLDENLSEAELGSDRIELIVKVVTFLEKKYTSRLEKYNKMLQSLEIDLLIVAFDLVYFGILESKSKSNIIKNLLNYIKEENLGKYSENWTFDFKYLEKYTKALGKVSGNRDKVKKVEFVNDLEKANFYELILLEFSYSLSPMLKSLASNNIVCFSELGINGSEFDGYLEKREFKDTSQIENSQTNSVIVLREFREEVKPREQWDKKNQIRNLMTENCLINLTQMNLVDGWIEIKRVFWEVFMPDELEKCNEITEKCAKISKARDLWKENFNKLLASKEKNFNKDATFKEYISQTQKYEKITMESKELSEGYENLINAQPLLSSYSNILALLYYSLKQYANLTNRKVYTWKLYLKLIEMVTKKLLRDLTSKKKQSKAEDSDDDEDEDDDSVSLQIDVADEGKKEGSPESPQGKKKKKKGKDDSNLSDEITIDEDFFSNHLLPNIWHIVTSSIPFDHIPSFNLLFTFNIGMKRSTIEQNDINFILDIMIERKDFIFWKQNDIMEGFSSSIDDESLTKLATRIKYHNRDQIAPVVKKLDLIRKASDEKNISMRKVMHELLKEDFKDLPLSQKMILSLYGLHSDVKMRFSQFIYEELSSIFAYQDEPIRIHSYIKIASWHIPIAVFSANNINVINTFCSIASFYGVDLEILEPPKGDLNKKMIADRKTYVLDKIKFSAASGAWIFITDSSILEYWKTIVSCINQCEAEGKVVNSFRIIFDFQESKLEELPIEFVTNYCAIMYVSDENMEDMEGFNDVWANILNQNMVDLNNMINMTMSEANDTKVANLVQNLKFLDESKLNRTQGNIFESDAIKEFPSVIVDNNMREELLNLSNVSIIKKLNDTRDDSVLETNNELLTGI